MSERATATATPPADPPGTSAAPAVRGRGILSLIGAPLALRTFEYWLYQYRRTWRASAVSTMLNPVLFLTAMGVGLGTLIDGSRSHGVAGLPYLVFLAPGLLAASAMQTGVGEASYPVMGALKWFKTYHAMLATPLGPLDLLVGQLLWMAVRVLTASAAYLVVMALFGAARSALVLLALPAAVLTGMAFAAPVTAFAATRNNDAGFAALFRFMVTPMFLFSGTFFPVRQLPPVLEHFAYITPLWHGVDLCRTLSLGTATVGMTALHVAYLAAWVIGGALVAAAAFRRRLVI
jgi:lipooligosaccharide transport system permease protein